jgi:hypothetical protein
MTMEFRIADTFTQALAKLTRDEQRAVKTSAFDMQMNPGSPGLQLHRIDASKDPNFWSLRVNRDIRIIVHNTAQSFLLAYVGHHDDAYRWAERRRIEVHPKTGAIQIVEVRERIEEITPQRPYQHDDILEEVPHSQPSLRQPATSDLPPSQPFLELSQDNLLSIGVPQDWISDIRIATEDQFLDLATHLPAEASEALLEYVSTGSLKVPAPVIVSDPYAHPDALRRIRVVENVEELEQALSYPWERWIVFLHPSQRAIVEQTFSGPARVSGSAGTGHCGRHPPSSYARQRKSECSRLAFDLFRPTGPFARTQARNPGRWTIGSDSSNCSRVFSRHSHGTVSTHPCPKTRYRFGRADTCLAFESGRSSGRERLYRTISNFRMDPLC